MKRFVPLFALALASACADPPASTTQQAATFAGDETPTRWFVELSSPPTADGGDAKTLANERAAFRSNAGKAGLKMKERYAYQSLFNGFSVEIDRGSVGALQRVPGVQHVYPGSEVEMPDSTPTTPDQQDWLSLTGADVAQNELGLHGDGVRVAVMDTGIDYLHPDLGGCFGADCRVTMGYDLVGDDYTGPGSDLKPDDDPMDCAGHGTHVSGIIGADGGGQDGHVTGVAPHVTFHAYRVFGCTGSTTDDVMLAAMEMILADGADVLNMSIGSAFADWSESPTAAGADRLVRKGVVVVNSAGNSGASGTFSTGAPATGTKVISVSSFENTTVKLPSFTITPDGRSIGYLAAEGAPPPPTSGSLPVQATSTTLGCSANTTSLAGKAALVSRGTCSFYQKAFNAQAAGAAAVIIYNNTSGFINPTVAGTPAITIPVVAVIQSDGQLIASRLATGAVTMTWTPDLVSYPNPVAGQVSSFSSLGPSAELDFKPDVGAPGGNIWSTYPLALGGYASLSGTSMASPHVAGSVALLLEAHPHTSPSAVRDLLQNNAVPTRFSTTSFLDSVHRQGAGLIHIDRTASTTTSVTPAKLALGDGKAGSRTQTLTFSNGGAAAITYDLTHVGGITTGPTSTDANGEFTPGLYVAPASVAFSATSVTVPAGGSATVNVTITQPTSQNLFIYGGWIVATPRAGGMTMRVPYMGMTGDYQAVTVLGLRSSGFPRLTRGDLTPVSDGASFTMKDANSIPYIVFQLAHAARTLKVQVYSAPATAGGSLGKSWQLGFKADYLGRNSTSGSLFNIGFDGVTSSGGGKSTLLPNGSYVMVMSAQKPLSDVWESWQSPVFTIAR